jgi:putative sterol carrier protein
MTSPTTEFFDDLARRGHEPMLERLSATLRWDILDGDRTEHRLIRIDHGDIRVSEGEEAADCVLTVSRTVCDEILSGRTSALAVLLRGAAAVEGDNELMVLAQRLLPRPETIEDRRRAVAAARRSS